MRIKTLSSIFILMLDILAMGSILLSGEIYTEVIAIPLLCGLYAFGFQFLNRGTRIEERKPIPNLALLLILISITIAVGIFSVVSDWHFLLIAASCAPIFHATLWLAPVNLRSKSLRLGLGFVELVITTSITPDLYVAALI
ncbi:MAG TPA: hypothetical protein EYO73_10265, partial [Sulfurimonas sp.]|nr:hypothetical protein [Sulfurimonas sp.]